MSEVGQDSSSSSVAVRNQMYISCRSERDLYTSPKREGERESEGAEWDERDC